MKLEIIVDPVGGVYTMRRCFYELDDDTVAGVVYTAPTGPNPCPAANIEAGDLSGTLQAYLDSLKGSIENMQAGDAGC